MVSKTVRTRATCLLVPNAARVRTKLLHHPDGGPTDKGYIYPKIAIHSHTPHNLLFGILSVIVFGVFGVISSLLVFCAFSLHSRYFSSLFLLQFIYFKLLEF
jgi:hypothetical protein